MAARRPTRNKSARIFVAVVAVAVCVIAGCGSGGEEPATEAEAVGEETAGSVAQLAQCRDWNRGDEAEKLATITDIRAQVNRPDSGFEAPPLSDAEAMELFDAACAPPYAQGFRLYILYARGAAAAPLVREQPPGG